MRVKKQVALYSVQLFNIEYEFVPFSVPKCSQRGTLLCTPNVDTKLICLIGLERRRKCSKFISLINISFKWKRWRSHILLVEGVNQWFLHLFLAMLFSLRDPFPLLLTPACTPRDVDDLDGDMLKYTFSLNPASAPVQFSGHSRSIVVMLCANYAFNQNKLILPQKCMKWCKPLSRYHLPQHHLRELNQVKSLLSSFFF